MMSRPAPSLRPRPAFTLVELLVVIVILGLLMALLLPAVQKAREAARLSACANNLKQVALAMANFEARNHHYPSSGKFPAPDAKGARNPWSAQAVLLPYLEQMKLYSSIDFQQSYELSPDVRTADAKLVRLSALRVPTYLCPSELRDEPRRTGNAAEHYPLNYAVNVGVWLVYDPGSGRGGSGVFYPESRTRTADLRDGLSFTLCAAEVKAWQPYYRNAALSADPGSPLASDVCGLGGELKTNSGHTEWVDGRVHQIGFTTAFPPNTPLPCDVNGVTYDVDWTNQQEGKSDTVATFAAVTARSYHGGGVNAALMDGSVRWFADEIHAGIWQAYSTRAGDELIPSEDQAK